MRGGVQKGFFPGPLNFYSLVVKYAMVKLMLIIQCIQDLNNQSYFYFTNSFAQADIPKWGQVFIEVPKYVNSNEG